MAGSGNTVTLTFAGDDRNLSRVLSGLTGKLSSTEQSVRKFGAATAMAFPVVGYAAGLVGGLTGAVGLLPAAALGAAAGIATLAIGFNGFGDAMSSMDDPAKFAEAIAKLSPAARSAALAVMGLKPQLDGLKAAVQDRMFRGMNEEISQLGNIYLPKLQSMLVGIADGFNLAALGVAGWLRSSEGVKTMSPMLDNIKTGMSHIAQAGGWLVQAFLQIASVGAPSFASMGEAIENAAENFLNFIERAKETGQLGQWIERGKLALKSLWEIIKPLLQGMMDLAIAFGQAGLPSALQMIADGFAKVAGFIRENNTVMVPLITTVGLLVLAFKGIMAVVGVINAVRNATVLWTAAQWLFNAAMWANPITWIVLAIVALIAAIVLCIVYWDEIKAAAVGAIDWIVARWNMGVALLSAAWALIKSVALAIWNAVTSYIAQKVAQAIAFIHRLSQIPGKVAAWFGQMKDRAIALAGQLVAWIAGLPGRILAGLAALGQLAARAAAWFGGMVRAGIRKGGEILSWMRGLPGRILSALGNLGSLLVSAGRDVVNGLWRGIQAGWSWLTGAVSNLASSLLAAAKGALGISSPSKEFRDEVGAYIPEGLAIGILNNMGVALAAARYVGERAAAEARKAAMSVPSDMATAASMVAARLRSGQQVFEDLTWRGAPEIVKRMNDQLLDAYRGNVNDRGGLLRFLDSTAAPAPQRLVGAGSISQSAWDQLLSMGYRGNPNDSREALYVPQSVLDQVTGAARSRSRPAAPVTVNVQGSILSERELVALIRDEFDRGGFRGVGSNR